LSFANAYGQIEEGSGQLSLGTQNAFIIEHDGASKKTVKKILENAIKEYGKVKYNRKAKEWNCLQCNVPGVSGPSNVYFKVEEGRNQSTSYVYVDNGSQFINSENDEAAAARITSSLTSVMHDITRSVISKELEDEEDNLNDRNKEQEKLEKKNKDLHNDIEKYKQKIKDAEKAIERNLEEQEDKKMEIEKQSRVVEEVVTRLNNVGKDQKKMDKKMEKKLKKMEKEAAEDEKEDEEKEEK